jgi:hypothetical protein
MPKPTVTPEWASNATFSAVGSAWHGSPTRLTPPAGLQEEGWEPSARPLAGHWNWILGYLSEWASWLGELFDEDGEHAYPTPPTRVVAINPFHAFDTTPAGSGWRGVAVGGAGNAYAVQAKADSAILAVPLNQCVPHGATISSIEVMVTLGATRAGADRVQVSWQQPVVNWAIPSATYGALEDTANDGGAAGGSTVTITVTPTPAIALESDNSGWPVSIVIKAGNNASTNPDNVHSIRVTYTDPGLRNT